ncbi:ABC transporter ATP-binding protein [Fusibacillus kribbianus]|uniref:ABC transporter ATP-binding protein n=1 Tax=Fusibacillus kribbianus TaxID=3044208 RepID=A0AAP4BB48_9FIRM|nr:ABC transporter ATP-binding protein [Ruminococcus sp. YH-rum2234]MDI9242400.1 ABC transporter ATP-binding protein [Ruminococcus sp. YH-rum2234]
MLSIKDLKVQYGGIQALRGVSLEVDEGEIITLIGANGAGKSTLVNSVMGIVPKSSGSVTYKGTDITKKDTRQIVKSGIILAPEGRHIFPGFTVRDNLMMGGYFGKADANDRELETVFNLFPILKERINQMGGTLSGGEQQMLAVGRALMAKPKIMMLDEPSLGLAPLVIADIFKLFDRIREMGVTIILIEQNARMALKVADRGYVIESGRIVYEDTAQNLLRSDAVVKAYLG